MKKPTDLEPTIRDVLEIVQHASEIISRLPLPSLRAYLETRRPGPGDPYDRWYSKALNLALAAQELDAVAGMLSAEEARTYIEPEQMVERDTRLDIPDDWSTG